MALPLFALLLIPSPALFADSAVATTPEEQSNLEDFVREFHPLNREERARLLGLFQGNSFIVQPRDPFNPPTKDNARQSAPQKTFWEMLSHLGFDLGDEASLTHPVAYDGEQLIVWAKPQTHRKLTDLLNHFRDPEQVRLTYWMEQETLDHKDKQSKVTTYPEISFLARSGKRCTVDSGPDRNHVSATTNIDEHGLISIMSLMKLMAPDGSWIEFDTEHRTLSSQTSELTALVFESETNGTKKTRYAYRIYCRAELIGPEGKVRPFNDSLIGRLNFSDKFSYEYASFQLTRKQSIQFTFPSHTKDQGAAFNAFFESQDILFNKEEGTYFEYDERNSLLSIRHTPETIHTIRELIAQEATRDLIRNAWQLRHALEGTASNQQEILEASALSLSGNKISLKYIAPKSRELKTFTLAATSNLTNGNSAATMCDIHSTAIEDLHHFKASFETSPSKDLRREIFAIERTLQKKNLKESLSLYHSVKP
ncbi:MAG: hypothetical protein ACPGSB_11040, partial [Opitutales bacterium]